MDDAVEARWLIRLDFLTTHASGIAACVESHITKGKRKLRVYRAMNVTNRVSQTTRPYGKRFSTLEKFHLSREGGDEDEEKDEKHKKQKISSFSSSSKNSSSTVHISPREKIQSKWERLAHVR